MDFGIIIGILVLTTFFFFSIRYELKNTKYD